MMFPHLSSNYNKDFSKEENRPSRVAIPPTRIFIAKSVNENGSYSNKGIFLIPKAILSPGSVVKLNIIANRNPTNPAIKASLRWYLLVMPTIKPYIGKRKDVKATIIGLDIVGVPAFISSPSENFTLNPPF